MTLFIDTHDSLITIALKTEEKLYIKTKESNYSHSIYVMPIIEELFSENNFDLKDLNKIIVVNGPGSFTGIRIGLTIAKTLAYTLNIDINTISSLKAYLVSSELTDANRMCIIEDNKGYYVLAVDDKNNVLIEESYVDSIPEGYKIVNNSLDINKIIDYLKDEKSENVHHIKSNYVKRIEVEK